MKRLILAIIALGATFNCWTASLVWTPSDANWDLITTNWLEGASTPMAFANGDDVLFDDSGGSRTSVLLSGTLAAGAVVIDASVDYTFAAANGGKLGDAASLTKLGTGKLVLETTNTIAGPTVIESGTLEIGTPAFRGTLGNGDITVYGTLAFNRSGTLNSLNKLAGAGTLFIPATSTGTLNLRGTNSMTDYSIVHSGAVLYFTNSWSLGTPASIQINASSVNERIQLAGGLDLPASCPITIDVAAGDQNTRASLMSVFGTNSFNGPIRIGGGYSNPDLRPNVNLYSQGSSQELVVNSSVEDVSGNPFLGNFYLRGNSTVGTGKLYGIINLSEGQLVKDEASTWTIYSTGNKARLTFVNGGRLNLAAVNALPDAQLTLNGTLDLGGYDQKVGPLWSLGTTATGLITNSAATDALLTLGDGGVYYGTLNDSGTTGRIGLKLLNPGAPKTQQFHGVCSYSGPTVLETATALALVGSGSIPRTTPISMANGTSIDASGRTDQTFTLDSTQTLKADGTVNIAGKFVAQGAIELKATKTGGSVTTDKVAVTGELTYGGTLKLALSGEALTPSDTLELFTAGSYAPGAFAAIDPATPATGLTWDTSTLRVDGTLRIAGQTSTPSITDITLAADGTKVIFTGTGGAPNGSFSVVASTNVTDAIATWSTVQTGLFFDASGNFRVTNAVTPAERQEFFRVRVP